MIRCTLALLFLLASAQPVLADCRQYFFDAIARTPGAAAPDWKAVLESLPGRGFGVNPRPDEIQPPNAKHFGMTVMIDAGGHARGRIWLATDQPTQDHNGNRWYTREVQVIADDGAGGFVWAWHELGGAAARPCAGSNVPPPVVTPPPSTPPPSAPPVDISALLAAAAELQKTLDALRSEVAAVKSELEAVKDKPVTVTLPCFSGRLGGFAPVTLCPKQ